MTKGHPIPIHQADTPGVDEPPKRYEEDSWTDEQHAAAVTYLTHPLTHRASPPTEEHGNGNRVHARAMASRPS